MVRLSAILVPDWSVYCLDMIRFCSREPVGSGAAVLGVNQSNLTGLDGFNIFLDMIRFCCRKPMDNSGPLLSIEIRAVRSGSWSEPVTGMKLDNRCVLVLFAGEERWEGHVSNRFCPNPQSGSAHLSNRGYIKQTQMRNVPKKQFGTLNRFSKAADSDSSDPSAQNPSSCPNQVCFPWVTFSLCSVFQDRSGPLQAGSVGGGESQGLVRFGSVWFCVRSVCLTLTRLTAGEETLPGFRVQRTSKGREMEKTGTNRTLVVHCSIQ